MTRWLFLLPLILVGCVAAPTIPMETVTLKGSPDARRPVLFVLLPGRWDRPDAFARQGFVTALEEAGIDADVIAADAHLGYYLERVFLPRLRNDVIEPAKARGYRRIWLAGVSLGGLGSLLYDAANPGDLEGIVAIAPYLGEPETVEEVAAAGGARAYWPDDRGALDASQEIWKIVGGYVRSHRPRGRAFLGYGTEDDFAPANGILARALPAEQTATVEGGHDWSTWLTLWRDLLPRLPIRR